MQQTGLYFSGGERVKQNKIYTLETRQTQTLILSTNIDKKIVRNSFGLPFVARLATNGNPKHCFYRFLFHARRLSRAFSIEAYPV